MDAFQDVSPQIHLVQALRLEIPDIYDFYSTAQAHPNKLGILKKSGFRINNTQIWLPGYKGKVPLFTWSTSLDQSLT